VIDRLMQTLKTPSEPVQRSASLALSPLVAKLDSKEWIDQTVVPNFLSLLYPLFSSIPEHGKYEIIASISILP
jgi:hypothetical protein